jgi:ATP-binding cassette subfamily B protein
MSGSFPWDRLAWPASAANQAISALHHALSADPSGGAVREPIGASWSEESVSRTVRSLGLQAEPVSIRYRDLEWFLRRSGPSLVRIPGSEDQALVILGARFGRARLLPPDGRQIRIKVSALADALRAPLSADVARRAAEWLDRAGIRGRRRVKAEHWLIMNELGVREAAHAWHIEPGEDAGWRAHFRDVAWGRRLARVLGVHALAYFLWLPAWGLLAWMSFGERMSSGWWWAWILICLTMFPLRADVMLSSQFLATDLIARVRQRLLSASMRLDPDRVRHVGVGHMLGVAIEVSEVNTFLQTGALVVLTTLMEIGVIATLLFVTAGADFGLSMLASLGLILGLAWIYYRRCSTWTQARMELTHDDVERMVGHRTRTVQESPEAWHIEEDHALDRYLYASRRMDRVYVLLRDALPRGWFILSFAVLLVSLSAGRASPAMLAGGALGAILGWRSLRALATALAEAAQAIAGWQRVRIFLEARAEGESPGDPALEPPRPPLDGGGAAEVAVLEAREVRFQHQGRPQPVLQSVSVRIGHRDRIRLEGVSGGGKSTLASLLAQARRPSSGLVLYRGVDVNTVGTSAWRKRVVLVPQFHDNHVLMGPLAFNVLMGRRWPPTTSDLEEAEEICSRLGLGPLIERMPAGMLQLVGETGWQLSHGERTRLFMARALAQRPEVLILDESLAALDPESLRLAASYLEEQEASLMLIAHP